MAGLEVVSAMTDALQGTYPVSLLEQKLVMPRERRTAGYAVADGSGAVDPRAGGADPLKDCLATLSFEVTYGGTADAYASATAAWDDFIVKCAHGRPLTVQLTESDGSLRFVKGAKVTRWDKATMLQNIGWVAIQCTIWMPDPYPKAQFRPGVRRLDTGNILDSGQFLDVDPDVVAVTSTAMPHTITNTGSAADEAPVVKLTGPLTAPIYLQNNSIPVGNTIMYHVYGANIASGETVTIDFGTLTVLSSDSRVDAYSNFYVGPGIGFEFRIEVGPNNLSLVSSGYGAGAYWGTNWIQNFL